jgi:ABC-type cobalt transport system substrate-binding protein
MKKLVQILLVVCMMLISMQVVFANAEKVTVMDGADLTSIHRLAIAAPQYTPLKNGPDKAAFTSVLYNASSVARMYVVSKDDMEKDILRDASVDVNTLDKKEANKVFKENIAKYADAYVVATVANNSRVVCFYDVYKAGTNELLYSYQIVANGSDADTVATYMALTQQFYKNFDRSAQKQLKDNEKGAKQK